MDVEKKDEEGRNNGSFESQNKILISCLYDDTMTNILTMVPADDLFSSVSYTCKSWSNIISKPHFPEAQLLCAKPGVFLQRITFPYGARLLGINDNGEYEVTTDFSHNFPGRFVNSSCGIILLCHYGSGDLHVANPVTMKALGLPPILSRELTYPPCAIVRVPRSGEFKVFASDVVSNQFGTDGFSNWYVLNLGKDNNWKKINEELSVFEFRCPPIYIEGNDLYWITQKTLILMDVDTETFREFLIPEGHQQWHSQYMKIGNRLASIIYMGSQEYQIHTFDSETGTWDFLHKMKDLDYPTGGLEVLSEFFEVWINEELVIRTVLMPNIASSLFSYNMMTRTLRKIDAVEEGLYDVGIHTNSLLSWKSIPPEPNLR